MPDEIFPRYVQFQYGLIKVSMDVFENYKDNNLRHLEQTDLKKADQCISNEMKLFEAKKYRDGIARNHSFPNRYPPGSMSPETWQGWRELEESLTPSTMRDEIRLTRIIIQYCDTEDEAVLEELKEWFSDMNEIQRTCMAKSVLDRARNSYGNDILLNPYRDLYHAVREYDISAKTESDVEFFKGLGLIE